MVLSDLVRVKRLELRLIGDTVLQLTYTGEDASAVGLMLATLATHAKLDSKPVDSSQTLQFYIGGTDRCQTDFLREVCKFLMRKHRGVTHQLVNDVRLRRV